MISDLFFPSLPNGLVIEDLEVTLNITHPDVSQLRIVLEDPSGTQRVLVQNGTATGANFTNTTFSSQGTGPLTGHGAVPERYLPHRPSRSRSTTAGGPAASGGSASRT